MRKLRWIPAFLAPAVFLAACATAPSGRTQLILVSDADMNRMGVTAFDQIKSQGKLATNKSQQAYVSCVANALIAQLPAQWRQQPWEVVVIQDDTANAFALPGGKVGVHTGLLKVAANQDQLASVIGHELGHVVSRHAAERVSQQYATETALQVLDAGTGGEKRTLLGLLGLGAQAGVLLPFSRKHETEADLEGQRLMARAGFDPAAAVTLWQRMQQSGGGSGPTWMSTHPNPQGRINQLNQGLAAARPEFERAHAEGRLPSCRL